jgi:hypothetical protein
MSDFVEKNESELKEVAENKDEEKNDNDNDNEKRLNTKNSKNENISHTHNKSVNERFNTLSINDRDMN